MAKKNKTTFRMYAVIKKCHLDFGQGVGVVGRAEATFTDATGRGFGCPTFAMAKMEQAEQFLKQHFTVLMEPKVKGRGWNENPMKIKKAKVKRVNI